MVDNSKTRPKKLGILGASKIVPQAILTPAATASNVEIAGVASSDNERGYQFAEQHNIARVYAGYQELLDDPAIDAVYVALSNDLHTPYIVAAAEAKKHILVEKPACITGEEFRLIRNAVEKNNVVLHEANMAKHHPWQRTIKSVIDSGQYGTLKSIKTRFTYKLATRPDSYRLDPARGGGSFYDNAPYWIQFVQFCIGLSPIEIYADSEFNGPNGIDMNFTTSIRFSDNIDVSFFASYEHPFEADHILEFTDTQLKIRNFLRPSYGRQKLIVKIEGIKSDKIIFPEENYFENQLSHFIDIIDGKEKPESLSLMQERIELVNRIYQVAKSKSLSLHESSLR